ncbi:MAG: arginase [delta proteobacterium ML8_F1]|nr:MAG: arginase [delta proteobacterium ML8_F1]
MENSSPPITGICTFGRYPLATDLKTLKGTIGVLGIPYDMGVGFLSGTRLGPRRIREASTQYGRGERGYYDPDKKTVLLNQSNQIVDCGDAEIVTGDQEASFANIEKGVRNIIDQGLIPAVMGGDHSVSIPVARALSGFDDLAVIQIDAHLDWSKTNLPGKITNGCPMRAMSEMGHFSHMVQIGLRGMGSSLEADFQEALDYGSLLLTAKEARTMGIERVLEKIPSSKHYYVTIDIDAYDITLAPGTGSPMPGGLDFDTMSRLLEGIAGKGEVVAFDLVEVAPQYDPAGITPRIAALTMLQFMGFILKEKEISTNKENQE